MKELEYSGQNKTKSRTFIMKSQNKPASSKVNFL